MRFSIAPARTLSQQFLVATCVQLWRHWCLQLLGATIPNGFGNDEHLPIPVLSIHVERCVCNNFWLPPPLLTLLLNTRRNALQRAALAAGGDLYDVSGMSKLDDQERQQRWMAAASLQELLKQADAQTHYDEE